MHFERFHKRMYEPVEVPNWLLLVYESHNRFNQESVEQIVEDFVKGCEAVGETLQASSTGHNYTKDLIGIKINPEPAFVRREAGQGFIARVSRPRRLSCRWLTLFTATQCCAR
jgi:hypothetical protein